MNDELWPLRNSFIIKSNVNKQILLVKESFNNIGPYISHHAVGKSLTLTACLSLSQCCPSSRGSS